MSECTPTTDDVRETYERARYYLDDMPEEGDSYRAGGGEFDRWLAAHDAEIREQVAREIEALHVPIAATERQAIRNGAIAEAAKIARASK